MGPRRQPIDTTSATSKLLVCRDSSRRNVQILCPVALLDCLSKFLGGGLNYRHRHRLSIGAKRFDVLLLHFLGNIAVGGVIAAGVEGDGNMWHGQRPFT